MPKDLENVNPEGFGSAMLDSFTIDISHQEMERIIVELELLHKTQPAKWLPIEVRPVKSSPTAAAAMANVLVKASGRNRRPSCA